MLDFQQRAVSKNKPSTKALASQKVEAWIHQAILEGRLKPRERVIEDDIANELGCSRGPVREALLRLERDGMIVITPRRGTFVRDFSAEDVEALFGIRGKLEGLAAKYLREAPADQTVPELRKCLMAMKAAAENVDGDAFFRADMALHETIWRLSQKPQLYATLRFTLNPLFFMVARKYTRVSLDNLLDEYNNHEAYVKMIYDTPAGRVDRVVEQYFSRLFDTLDRDVFHTRGTQSPAGRASGMQFVSNGI